MALPHMPSSYTTRKNIYEAAIVNRRTHENDFREKWSKNAQYFNVNNVAATKKHAWESSQSYNASMDAWRQKEKKAEKEEKLKARRDKLAKLLQQEREQFKIELCSLPGTQEEQIEDMKSRCETLRSAREDRRRRLADDLLYEHWRTNNADVRHLESRQHEQHVISKWEEQEEEKQRKAEEERKAKEEIERQMEEDRLLALELEQEKARERDLEERALKEVLKNQMTELKRREDEASELKRQEDQLMAEQWEVEKLEIKRQAMEQERKKVEFGRILLRQHAAALKSKSKKVQDELAEDLQLLSRLAEQEAADREIRTARKEKAKADATWMKQVVEEQLRLEKAREAELDMLYADEAARQWQKREGDWEKERIARERLMKEVLNVRAEQIEDKMEMVRAQQAESIERREELLRDLEIANQLTQREVKQQEEAKTARKEELEAQISARRQQADDDRLALRLELDDEEDQQQQYNDLIQHEADRITARGYKPKVYGRKTAWI